MVASISYQEETVVKDGCDIFSQCVVSELYVQWPLILFPFLPLFFLGKL